VGAALRRETWPIRLGAAGLACLIFLGSVVLVAMPLGSLWLLSQLDFAYTEIYLLAFLACPAAVIAWGIVLVHLNRLYLQLAGPKARPVLEISITTAVMVSLAGLVVFAVFADSPGVPLGP
jgi:hypothetical protein